MMVSSKNGEDMAMEAALLRPTGVASLLPEEPSSLEEAKRSPEWPQWSEARAKEKQGFITNRVWTQEPRPKEKLVVGTKEIFTRKIGKDGEVEKYKCRLVAKGFRQVKGLHYQETFSPTPAAASIRLVLATAAVEDRELRHLDVEQAFLQADIDEEVYIELPEDFQEFPGAVGRLNKAVYGLVQAGRCFNIRMTGDLKEMGFEQSHADPCVFRKVVDKEAVVVVVIHVDDLLVSSRTKEDEEEFVAELHKRFKMKDMGEAEFYMGCHISRNRQAKTLSLDQHVYVQTVADRFQVTKTSSTPAATGIKPLSKEDGAKTPAEREEMENIPYREAVGALMWAATMTRLDIASAVREVAKFSDNPGRAHWKAVRRILQYIARTKDRGITYGGQKAEIEMTAYADSDHATCLDTRRSVSGGAVLLGGGRDQLVLQDTEGHRYRDIGIGVRGSMGGDHRGAFSSSSAGVRDSYDQRLQRHRQRGQPRRYKNGEQQI